ncbi:TetR/AcrR family transcriptional regulator [Paraburkholderia pallida]|uniref:TetR/AcrR family transcriptional regulator n=1 Tax=Paraburkholderia pallida TaxID=2547399 RepID=A0A4P7D771_9BURK|nr:TetR/AcrR family transcriptional regulator [Paraburkholderia pallida]QBR02765.1 TetR/AcrR family transcriptional regulator [Paraburkholderia pallida]
MGLPQQAETVSKLIAAGMTILGTSGETAVTIRNVAAAAGLSAPTVQRHFPAKEDLLLALHDAALERDAARLAQLGTVLPALGPRGMEGAQAIACALIADSCGANASDTLARVAALASIARRDGARSMARRWASRRQAVLAQALAGTVAAPRRDARFLLEYLTGVELLSLGCRRHPMIPILNAELVEHGFRVAIGQSRAQCPAWFRYCASQVLRERHQENQASQGGRTAHARDVILAASARILAEHGPAELTHRAVAKEAQIAPSLVSYHFRSKNDLLYGAYRYIHDRFATAPVPATTSPTRATLNVVIDTGAGAKPAYVASLETIIAAAYDSELADFAWRTRMTRGVYYLHPEWSDQDELNATDFSVHAFSVWTVGATLLAQACWTGKRREQCLHSRFAEAEQRFSTGRL